MHLERNELRCNTEERYLEDVRNNRTYVTSLSSTWIIPLQFLGHAGINSELTRNNPATVNCIYALVNTEQCVSAGKTKRVQGDYQRCSGIAAGSCELWGGF